MTFLTRLLAREGTIGQAYGVPGNRFIKSSPAMALGGAFKRMHSIRFKVILSIICLLSLIYTMYYGCDPTGIVAMTHGSISRICDITLH